MIFFWLFMNGTGQHVCHMVWKLSVENVCDVLLCGVNCGKTGFFTLITPIYGKFIYRLFVEN